MIIGAFASALEKALTPIRKELAQLNESWSGLSQTLARASKEQGPATAPRRAQAAVVEPAPRRQPAAPSADDEQCLVPRCPAPILAKQLCETHYRIMRRNLAAGEPFDPAAQRPARARKASKTCEESGCSEPHYAKGLCRRHYMAARSRIRAAERGGATKEPQDYAPESEDLEDTEDSQPTFTIRSNGGDPGLDIPLFQEAPTRPISNKEALPTAEVVSRVVTQYRGGLDRVAEVLGRNKRTLLDLLDQLDLMPFVTRVRNQERQRIESAKLSDRLNDLLFREKLLEDLGCLKDVDDRARFEVKMLCNSLAKQSETVEDVLHRLSKELKLDEGGMKRLVWRYDLRRLLRGLKLKPATAPVRTRA